MASLKIICLNMIVKNEASVLARCLNSIKPFIHYWVIVDTGSTDGTQAIIQQTLQEIPGELYERPWVDFAHNRNEALELARPHGDYLLIIDADEILSYTPGFSLPELNKDCYFITVQEELVTSKSLFLIRSNFPWRWEGVLHETLVSTTPPTHGHLQQITNISRTKEGARSKTQEKYKLDAAILEKALEKNPSHPRYTFYLAQSYANANLPELALQAFKKRAKMKGCPEEIFWSLYQIGMIQDRLNYDRKEVISSYHAAYLARPIRAEPLYCLSSFYLKYNNPLLAYVTARHARSLPFPNDFIFVIPWIYQYGIADTYAHAAHLLNRLTEAHTVWTSLLSQPALPPSLREEITQHLRAS